MQGGEGNREFVHLHKHGYCTGFSCDCCQLATAKRNQRRSAPVEVPIEVLRGGWSYVAPAPPPAHMAAVRRPSSVIRARSPPTGPAEPVTVVGPAVAVPQRRTRTLSPMKQHQLVVPPQPVPVLQPAAPTPQVHVHVQRLSGQGCKEAARPTAVAQPPSPNIASVSRPFRHSSGLETRRCGTPVRTETSAPLRFLPRAQPPPTPPAAVQVVCLEDVAQMASGGATPGGSEGSAAAPPLPVAPIAVSPLVGPRLSHGSQGGSTPGAQDALPPQPPRAVAAQPQRRCLDAVVAQAQQRQHVPPCSVDHRPEQQLAPDREPKKEAQGGDAATKEPAPEPPAARSAAGSAISTRESISEPPLLPQRPISSALEEGSLEPPPTQLPSQPLLPPPATASSCTTLAPADALAMRQDEAEQLPMPTLLPQSKSEEAQAEKPDAESSGNALDLPALPPPPTRAVRGGKAVQSARKASCSSGASEGGSSNIVTAPSSVEVPTALAREVEDSEPQAHANMSTEGEEADVGASPELAARVFEPEQRPTGGRHSVGAFSGNEADARAYAEQANRICSCQSLSDMPALEPPDDGGIGFDLWLLWMVHRVALNDPTLTVLDLGGWEVPDAEQEPRVIPKLFRTLASNTHLIEVKLEAVGVAGLPQVQLIAEAIMENRTLKVLDLSANCLEPAQIGLIFDALYMSPKSVLHTIHVSNQLFVEEHGRETEQQVAMALMKNRTMRTLGMDLDDPHWRDQIQRCLVRNREEHRKAAWEAMQRREGKRA
eukprot:TRINITY_DN19917_c0_g1_i1.p1 TRINITY_DN19917_c0_g1~~TRINITY_DN19917_c0_g1_i1.p1  ORF type:complete len:769 (-),score=138.82 TRINITY_DN19917_c0_g1_i1:316-2622(-)